MSDKKTVSMHVKGVPVETHKAIKIEAAKRNILMNDLILKVLQSGTKRLKIVTEKS
jgi:hypothetical protein